LFELPLPVFFCFTSWSVLVSLSSACANGDDLILEAHGVAGSPYDLEVNEQTSSPDNEEPLGQLEALDGLD
jgi:hypothetical protein